MDGKPCQCAVVVTVRKDALIVLDLHEWREYSNMYWNKRHSVDFFAMDAVPIATGGPGDYGPRAAPTGGGKLLIRN